MYILIAFFITANPTPAALPNKRRGSHSKRSVRKRPVRPQGPLSKAELRPERTHTNPLGLRKKVRPIG